MAFIDHIDHFLDNFCRLVRHCGTDYQCLLTFQEIEAELSAEDRAELETLDRHNKQTWAEMLAYRLCKDRKAAPIASAPHYR